MVPKNVAVTDLAEILGLTDGRIHQLTSDGIIKKARRGAYPLAENVQSYVEYAKNQVKSSSKDAERLDKLKADKLEIELSLLRGEMIKTDEAIGAWGKVVASSRSRLLSIPKKTAPLMVGSKSISAAEDILNRVIYEALKELASPDLVDIALGISAEKRTRAARRK